jgi:hypothetical protein
MTTTAPQANLTYEIVEHSMRRIIIIAEGSFDEFQKQFEATMPTSAPQDVMAQVKTWQQGRAGTHVQRPSDD